MKVYKSLALVVAFGVATLFAVGAYRYSHGCCPMTGQPLQCETRNPRVPGNGGRGPVEGVFADEHGTITPAPLSPGNNGGGGPITPSTN